LEVKDAAFPCSASIRNSGFSFIILIFMVSSLRIAFVNSAK
jgi:hypothetical protein